MICARSRRTNKRDGEQNHTTKKLASFIASLTFSTMVERAVLLYHSIDDQEIAEELKKKMPLRTMGKRQVHSQFGISWAQLFKARLVLILG